MRWIVFLVGLLVAVPAAAQPKLLQAHASSTPTYQGLIDVVVSPTVLYSLRAGSAAIAAAGTQTLVNIRRASDNVACDFLPTTLGGFGVTTATCNSSTQGGVSYGTFVGTDATASCTIAGTAVACTGASATLHVNDPITGVGITNPCVVTVTNGSTTATASLAGTATTCGTVSVAETVTFQVAGFVPEIYDQSGNGFHATQATAGTQAQFLPNGGNSLPTLNFTGSQFYTATITSLSVPYSGSFVSIRTAAFTSIGAVLGTGAGHLGTGFINSTNTAFLDGGGSAFNATASDSVLHAFQFVVNIAATSVLNVDGTDTTGSAGSVSSSTAMNVGRADAGTWPLTGRFYEGGLWPGAFSSGNRSALHTNQSVFYGTP